MQCLTYVFKKFFARDVTSFDLDNQSCFFICKESPLCPVARSNCYNSAGRILKEKQFWMKRCCVLIVVYPSLAVLTHSIQNLSQPFN